MADNDSYVPPCLLSKRKKKRKKRLNRLDLVNNKRQKADGPLKINTTLRDMRKPREENPNSVSEDIKLNLTRDSFSRWNDRTKSSLDDSRDAKDERDNDRRKYERESGHDSRERETRHSRNVFRREERHQDRFGGSRHEEERSRVRPSRDDHHGDREPDRDFNHRYPPQRDRDYDRSYRVRDNRYDDPDQESEVKDRDSLNRVNRDPPSRLHNHSNQFSRSNSTHDLNFPEIITPQFIDLNNSARFAESELIVPRSFPQNEKENPFRIDHRRDRYDDREPYLRQHDRSGKDATSTVDNRVDQSNRNNNSSFNSSCYQTDSQMMLIKDCRSFPGNMRDSEHAFHDSIVPPFPVSPFIQMQYPDRFGLLQSSSFSSSDSFQLRKENERLKSALVNVLSKPGDLEPEVKIVFKHEELAVRFRSVIENFVVDLFAKEGLEIRDAFSEKPLFSTDETASDGNHSFSSVPLYEIDVNSSVDHDGNKTNDSRISSSTCFNCSGSHFLSECPETLCYKRIAGNRAEKLANAPLPNVRYHVSEDRPKHFKPGVISDELRDALQLEPNQIPSYIYNMRLLGYPPGWLEEAKVKSSGLSMIGLDVDSVEDSEMNGKKRSQVQFDCEKLIDYPGFNVPLPPGFVDESEELGLPSFQPSQMRLFMEHNFEKPDVRPKRRKELEAAKLEKPVSFSRMEEDMEVVDECAEESNASAENGDSGAGFIPPLPSNDVDWESVSLPPVPPPPPPGTTPPPPPPPPVSPTPPPPPPMSPPPPLPPDTPQESSSYPFICISAEDPKEEEALKCDVPLEYAAGVLAPSVLEGAAGDDVAAAPPLPPSPTSDEIVLKDPPLPSTPLSVELVQDIRSADVSSSSYSPLLHVEDCEEEYSIESVIELNSQTASDALTINYPSKSEMELRIGEKLNLGCRSPKDSPSLDELEERKRLIMQALCDAADDDVQSDGSSSVLCLNSQVSVVESENSVQEDSCAESVASSQKSLESCPLFLGSPSVPALTSFRKLPNIKKFGEGIQEHLPYENLPNSTGVFEQMKGVLQKVREKMSQL